MPEGHVVAGVPPVIENGAGKESALDSLEMLRVALDRLIGFVVAHQGPQPYSALEELSQRDQEVSALCQVTKLVLPPITYLSDDYGDRLGFCQVSVLRHSLGLFIFGDRGWLIAMQGLLKTVEWEKRRVEARGKTIGKVENSPVVQGEEACAGALGKSICRREGEYWQLTFGGKTIRLKNRLGLQYIAALIEQKGREMHAVMLLTEVSHQPAFKTIGGAEILDDRAREEYRKRYEDLRFQLEEADKNDDLGTKAKIQGELNSLSRELQAHTGLGERKRKIGDDAERVRKSVSMAISRTIQAVTKKHPPLGRHLEDSIRMGQFMSYLPAAEIDWIL